MIKHKQLMSAAQLVDQLKHQAGCDYFTGVPDGALKMVHKAIKPSEWYAAPTEHHALAMAFGARIGGAKPCVVMQNSGVGYLGDVVLGITALHERGVIMVVGCRGEFENEEPQHRMWGISRTRQLLGAMKVSMVDLLERENAVIRAADLAWRLNRTVAILVRRGVIDES